MRIIYLHQYFNTPEMAGGTRSYEMAKRLVASGHEVHLVTTWRETDGRTDWFITNEDGIHVHWQPVPYSNNMGFWARIRAFLRFALGASRYASRLDADLVFATSTPLTIAIPAIYTKRRKKLPMVFEVRDLWPDVPIALGVLRNPILKWLARRLELLAYRNSTRIVTLAPGMKEAVAARGIEPDLIDVIPNGADLTLFHGQNVDCGALRQRYGIAQEGQVILYAGTLGMVNGVDYIVELASELNGRNLEHQCIFVVIGEGREFVSLCALAEKLAVLDRSVFFLGSRPKQEVARWYHCSVASIMTYSGPELVYKDSVSNKFFDSLAAGRPVLANFRGFSTIIAEKNRAGKILPKDPAAAAGALVELLEDENWLRSSGLRARQLGEREFARDKLACDLEQTLLLACSGEFVR